MVKVTLKTIDENYKSALDFFNLPMSALLAFKMAKNKKILDGELRSFMETRDSRIKELGDETTDGTYKVRDENLKLFNDELKSLLSAEVELPMQSVSISSVGEAGLRISPSTAMALVELGILVD